AVSAGWAWWRRPERPTLTEGSVLVLASLQVGAILGLRTAVGWDWQRIMYGVAYAALVFLHVGVLWPRRRDSCACSGPWCCSPSLRPSTPRGARAIPGSTCARS